jgi:hypothetical protein
MKRIIFSTVLAAALVMPTAAFAGQRGGGGHGGGGHAGGGHAVAGHGGGGWGHGGWGHGGWGGGHVIVSPYYYGGFYGAGWGWGWYDPFWGAYDWGDPYGGYVIPSMAVGHLRLEATPKDAQVFVDGTYAGVVDDFDGHFQHLDLPPGGHHIELKSPGFATTTFDVYIQPDHTTDYRGRLTAAD